jgi:phosphoribosyl 1,2-cyclic phosphodiesterase
VALGTVWRWRDLREVPHEGFVPGDAFDVGPFRVRSIAVPHDVADAAAFVVDDPATGARAAYATDLGEAPAPLVAALGGAHALVLEANHDPALLAAGPYPPEVKTRVAGAHGHLSNAQAAEVLARVAHPGLAHVVLGHVSRHNNTPALARAAAEAALAGTGFRGAVHVAPQDAVLGPLAVAPPPTAQRAP